MKRKLKNMTKQIIRPLKWLALQAKILWCMILDCFLEKYIERCAFEVSRDQIKSLESSHQKIIDDLKASVDVLKEEKEIDYTDLADRVDVEDLACYLDTYDVASYVDVEGLACSIDTGEVASHLDSAEVADNISLGDLEREISYVDLADELNADVIAGCVDPVDVASQIDKEELAKALLRVLKTNEESLTIRF